MNKDTVPHRSRVLCRALEDGQGLMCCFPSSEAGGGVTASAAAVPLSGTELAEELLRTGSVSFFFFSLLHVLAMWSAFGKSS